MKKRMKEIQQANEIKDALMFQTTPVKTPQNKAVTDVQVSESTQQTLDS